MVRIRAVTEADRHPISLKMVHSVRASSFSVRSSESLLASMNMVFTYAAPPNMPTDTIKQNSAAMLVTHRVNEFTAQNRN